MRPNAHVLMFFGLILDGRLDIQNALAAIQSPPSILYTILLSTDGLHLGDIHFAKIQTTLGMWTVAVTVLREMGREWALQFGG